MKSLKRYKFASILLVIVVLLSAAVAPAPAYAWSAVVITNNYSATSFWDYVVKFSRLLFREPAYTIDLGSHQLIIKLAYAKLSESPAYKDQKDIFPGVEDIVSWDEVIVKDKATAIFGGGAWRDGKKGGPDADGRSKDSEHYYNPSKGGDAPSSVETHFSELLLQMYDQGNFAGKTKPNDSTNNHAAWSAHYLADIFVPYHVVGMPATEVTYNPLSIEESGLPVLWEPDAAKLNEDDNIEPSSIVNPPPSWGLDGDFTKAIDYFKYKQKGDREKRDWFDPWYYTGVKGMGSNISIGVGSHASWESSAHRYITSNGLAKIPAGYSVDWENAKPEFGKPVENIENQAAQAKAFTIAQATGTKNNTGLYLKKQELAFNKAIEAVATLWRASLTALRPEIKVEPVAGNPKLLKVTATVRSVEPSEPATKVKARLTATDGTIRGKRSMKPANRKSPL